MGKLAELEELAGQLKLKIEGLRDAIRMHLPQFEPVEDINLEAAVAQAIEARAAQIDYKEALEMIKAIKKALGR
jgi:predicted PhzF superfamily epimerase YddE/YHI9